MAGWMKTPLGTEVDLGPASAELLIVCIIGNFVYDFRNKYIVHWSQTAQSCINVHSEPQKSGSLFLTITSANLNRFFIVFILF